MFFIKPSEVAMSGEGEQRGFYSPLTMKTNHLQHSEFDENLELMGFRLII